MEQSNNIRELYARFHQLNVEKEELPELVQAKRPKVQDILGLNFPWADWYEIPYKQSLGVFLVISGLDKWVIKASKSENPGRDLFDQLDNNPDPMGETELSNEEKSYFIALFMSIMHQMESLSIFSESISELVRKAVTDDEKLFDAVIVDRSVVACPSIAQRIQIAQLEQDESFMNKLSKAITKTRSRKPNSEYDDLRFMLEALEDMKECQDMTLEQKYELLAGDLELYNTSDKKDSLAGFKKLVQRRNKRKET